MSGQWRKIKQLRGHLEDLSTLFTVVHSSVLTIQIQIQVRKLQRPILKHKYKIKQLNCHLEDLSALFTVDHSSVLTTQIQIQKLQIQIQKIQIQKPKHKYKIKQLGDGGRLEDLSALFTNGPFEYHHNTNTNTNTNTKTKTKVQNKAASWPPWRFVHAFHNGPFPCPHNAANTANHSNCLYQNSSGRWK